ncbi:MAG: hypothetical protein WD509_01850 [Candidatus Paceibacterota bacterium]
MGDISEIIIKDFSKAVSLAIAAVSGIFSLFCLSIAIKVWRTPPEIWERNRRAALLCKEVKQGKGLTPDKKIRYNNFLRDGVIDEESFVVNTKTGQLVRQPRLSESAVDDVLHS